MRVHKNAVMVITIDYDEGKPETYRGVEITMKGVKMATFATGVPQDDFERSVGYVGLKFAMGICSSTIDTFQTDGGELDTTIYEDDPVYGLEW